MTYDARIHGDLTRLPDRIAEQLAAKWYTAPRVIETPPKRTYTLPVAVGHAVFFLALALAGWLR